MSFFVPLASRLPETSVQREQNSRHNSHNGLMKHQLFLRTSLSTEREIHSSGGFGSMRKPRSLSITSVSFLVNRSRWSKCSFQEGATTSIRNLFGWFRSSYKCHLYAPFRKKISRASRINLMHSIRRAASTWNSALTVTRPSLGPDNRQ